MCGLVVYTGDISKLASFEDEFKKLRHRGPDDTEIVPIPGSTGAMAFHRLAIMDTTSHGNQPLVDASTGNMVVCNGEVYNYPALRAQFDKDYHFTSHSDCEAILPLFKRYGIRDTALGLDAEYAFVIYEASTKKFFAARDPIGIRPLFYGHTRAEGKIMFASEAKALTPYCQEVHYFPPGHYYDGEGRFIEYRRPWEAKGKGAREMDAILKGIREKLIEGVRKRLASDVPIGFLLSGGLDSSLVCSIAHKILGMKIETFSVGMTVNPIDIKYAKIVADYLGSKHHEVYFTELDVKRVLDELIFHLETWDITTIRASIGMYLVCKYVRERTDVRVVLTGEISDELFGYKYTDFAPTGDEFQKEAEKRIREIHMYDVLRADRCISANSLEARVPFGDLDFVDFVMAIPGKIKMNTYGMGKYLLRKAFEGDFLPHEILYRDKAAFSDAVGHSMVDHLKAHAEAMYTDEEFKKRAAAYAHGRPFTKEALMYREIFEKHFPGQSKLIADFWMPNKEWPGCNVTDPSARVLSNYGKSGQ